jgi:hypothetical protein
MSVKINGLDQFKADLIRIENGILDATKEVLSDTATNIERDAIAAAPTSYQIGDATINLSFIKQKIKKSQLNKGLRFKIGLSVPADKEQWEAWMEFGTGLSAREILSNPTYTEEVRLLARTYFRNGKGRIIGQPYLMPAFFRNTANLVQNLVTEITNKIK